MISALLLATQAPVAMPMVAPAIPWNSATVTPGSWSWRAVPGGSEANFHGATGVQFTLRCTLAARTVTLVRAGAPAGAAVIVRTTSLERTLPASGTVGARDPLLDALAFSRGRVSVEVAGLPRLILPAWPEAARAIEDCRK